ncbi:MAG TPA: hypothetical protein VHN79_00995 [Lacunisphaera sp.]|nr:hypothetical protein [Lacunisphaera sp.]
MKLPHPRFLALGLLLVASLHAGSRHTAFQAQAMLGSEIWSRVVRVQNDAPGRGSRYPAEFHGLVVAFEDILWFYTEFDGTQTLSRYSGRLEEDKADIGPLLQAIEPGLRRFEEITDSAPQPGRGSPPPYACFLASVARWQQLQREARPPSRARLLAYYPRGERQGHMVLEYWRDGRRYVFNPEKPADERELPVRLAEDPLKVARALFAPGDRKRPVRAMHLDLGGA